MERKTVSTMMLILLLTHMLTLAPNIQLVSGTSKATATSDLVFSDDFDDGDISDWTITVTGDALFAVSTDTSVSPPFSVHMKSIGNYKAMGTSPNYTLDLTSDYNVSLYFRLPHTNNHWFEVFNNHQIYLVIDYGSDFKWYKGGQPAELIMTLGTNQWYLIEIKAHPSSDNYDVYVNGEFKKTAPMSIHSGWENNFRIGDRADGSYDRGEAYWDDIRIYQRVLPRDVLIINDPHKHAYFGWYRASQMPAAGWKLLNRTLLWAASYMFPNETRIVFFNQSNIDAATVYNWLIGSGYSPENIVLHPTIDAQLLPSPYYFDFDLVIYWDTYGYNSTNIVNARVPFFSVSAMQTDEIGIGTGIKTLNASSDTFHIVNNNYYPTENYPLGPFVFESGMVFEATEAAGRGKVLVKAEVVSVGPQVEMSLMQDVAVLPGGSADISLTIDIPQSPLADMYREAFFSNVSALEPGVEYDVPENKTVHNKVELEEGVKDKTLLGDINSDGKLEIRDLAIIALAYGSYLGSARWNAELDLNWDGKIDIKDIAAGAKGYGKTRWTTGHLNVIGYYNSTAVDCTNVYYVGPERSAPMNMSASGHTWSYLRPGEYTIYGTYNVTVSSTTVKVVPEKTSYAQLDFGGAQRPAPPQSDVVPVREVFHLGIVIDQLTLLGFELRVTDSKIVPWGTNNETRISLMAYSPQLAKPIEYPMWRINVGPQDENATRMAAEFMFTKIQFIQQMLRQLPGEQVYRFNWRTGFELPPGAGLLNGYELVGKNWTIDFGGGTLMKANITEVASQRVVLNETMSVTEQNITASEDYLKLTIPQYRKFKIDYLHAGLLSQVTEVQAHSTYNDWENTWTWTISPGAYEKKWSEGSLSATIKATPELTIDFYVGWGTTWWGALDWFKTWMKITPSVKVEASVTATASYSKTWSYTFLTWSRDFSFWVGPVYVWSKLKLTVTGKLTVNAYGTISISTWVRAYAYLKAGVKWKRSDGGWSGIWEYGTGAEYYRSISGTASLSVTPEAICRLAFLFYDVAGPFVEGIPYAPMTIQWNPNTWSISLKFKVNAGVTFAGWLKDILGLSDWSKTLADWTLANWSGTW